MNILDVSHWEKDDKRQAYGKRQKFWLVSPYNEKRYLFKIPVFDAFIANQDRHCDNWGVIVEGSCYQLAPVYDNGASLGYQLNEERIIKMFEDQKMFEAFTNRSRSLIGLPSKKKPKYKELLSFIYGLYPKEIQEIIERIGSVDDRTIAIVLNEIPDICMNDIYKRWVSKLLLHRKQWLIKWYMEEFLNWYRNPNNYRPESPSANRSHKYE